jgi:uncharacterized phage protein (TIGR02218 family)
MTAFLQPELTTSAFLWKIDRRDGVTLGFTSHDRDLWRGGLCYRAAPGMVPSAIERSDGFDADSVELAGALTSDALRADDLLAGRYDGAALSLVMVDWTDPEGEALPLVRGELGTVETAGEAFRVDLRGPASILEAPVCEETSPDCRASLGDLRCRIDMAGRRRMASVMSIADAVVTLDQSAADGIYAFGRLRWLDGSNAGLISVIAASIGGSVTLREPPAFAVMPGTRIELSEGCDRRFSTCVSRFANAINFRGEPHLPGNDLLTRYAI